MGYPPPAGDSGSAGPLPPRYTAIGMPHPQEAAPSMEALPKASKNTMDPGATPRLESILRQLYASLSICIAIYLLGQAPRLVLLSLSPFCLLFTIIFASVMIMVTFRDRARLHPKSIKAPPQMPALCRLPSIITCFVIAVLWIVSLGLTILSFIIARPATSTESETEGIPLSAFISAGIGALFSASQIGLLMSVGIIAARERASLRKQKRASIPAMV